MKVGMAAGMSFQRGKHRHRVVIGKDTRLSGYMIENAMVAGFCAAGMDVFLLGPMPTPAVAMLTRSLRADLGVMISASHNPYRRQRHQAVRPRRLQALRRDRGEIEAMLDRTSTEARRSEPRSAAPSASTACMTATSNSPSAPCRAPCRWRPARRHRLRQWRRLQGGAAALWELGAEVVTIGVEPNGFNINQECGSTHPEALSKKVHEVRADIGIALDGDADRVVIVDENGRSSTATRSWR
jgi:phosphoglucosamine mutase